LQAEISSEQISTLLEATGNTEVEAFYPIIFANYLSNPSKVAALIASPGGAGGGGGGGGGGGAGGGGGGGEEKEEEKEEEGKLIASIGWIVCSPAFDPIHFISHAHLCSRLAEEADIGGGMDMFGGGDGGGGDY
jgi:uncharacterized membrane protein